MTNAEIVYANRIWEDYGDDYAATVRRLTDGFLADHVCRDEADAFARAVETTERLLPVIRARAVQ